MNRRGKAALVLFGAAPLSFLCLVTPALAQTEATAAAITATIDGDYSPTWIPRISTPLLSENGQEIDSLINYVHVFMLLLFVGWGIFFVYCLVRFRQKPGHIARPAPIKAKVAKWSEIGVAAFEAFLLIGLSIPVWADVKTAFPPESENPQHVRVMAEQFAWNFQYPGPDKVLGKISPVFIDLTDNPLGIDPSDPAGLDDVVSSQFHIVAGRPVIAALTSKDVIHSFFLPVMRVKQDVIPGMRIPVWFRPTDDSAGNYEVACAQLCGNNHYSMKALMVVHATQSEFDDWLAGQVPEDFDEDELE